MPLFLFIFHIFITYIQSSNHIHSIHSPSPLSISSLPVSSVGQNSLWCRAENRTRACLPASRRATNCATPHHTVPRRTITVPRRTMLCHAAPYCATPHHTVPRRTMLCHAAPYCATPHHYCATPHHAVPRRTILCHAAPCCATPHQ